MHFFFLPVQYNKFGVGETHTHTHKWKSINPNLKQMSLKCAVYTFTHEQLTSIMERQKHPKPDVLNTFGIYIYFLELLYVGN